MSLQIFDPSSPYGHIHAHFNVTPVTEIHTEKTENQYKDLCDAYNQVVSVPSMKIESGVKEGCQELQKEIDAKREAVQAKRAKALHLKGRVMKLEEELQCDEHALGVLEGSFKVLHGVVPKRRHHPMKEAAKSALRAHSKYGPMKAMQVSGAGQAQENANNEIKDSEGEVQISGDDGKERDGGDAVSEEAMERVMMSIMLGHIDQNQDDVVFVDDVHEGPNCVSYGAM